MSLEVPMIMTTKSASLAVPAKGRGHRHQRSAAISLDWRHITLPPVVEPQRVVEMPATSCSPTLTFASTLSDTSVEEEEEEVDATPMASTQASVQLTPIIARKRVSFLDAIEEIPPRDVGDTWMKPEDYSWPTPNADSKTILLDPVEPLIDLAPAIPTCVPGSPVLMHRKKRSSFLQTTKNALTRRPSKKRPSSIDQTIFDIPIPAPKSSMIDLDLVLTPNASLRHKKSGSLGTFCDLPASPSKPKSWHKRSGSAPADIVFSFSPRPASPESRKRKMSSIIEHPIQQATATSAAVENVADSVKPVIASARPTGLALAISDDMILGQPGEMVSTHDTLDRDSPAIAALRGHSYRDSVSLARTGSKKGWKGMLHRLLH